MELVTMEELKDLDVLLIAVAHKEFREIPLDRIEAMFKDCSNDRKIIIDVKGIKDRKKLEGLGYRYFSL